MPQKILIILPILFCLFIFSLGYLDILGAIRKEFLMGQDSLSPTNISDNGVLSNFLINYIILPVPGNFQIAQIMVVCFVVPFLVIEAISFAVRRKIDFVKAARRATMVSLLFALIIVANYVSIWIERQGWRVLTG